MSTDTDSNGRAMLLERKTDISKGQNGVNGDTISSELCLSQASQIKAMSN